MCCRYSQSYWVQIAPSSILSTLQKARETKLPRLSAKFTVQSISHKEDNLLKEWWVTFLWFAPARWVKVHWKCVTMFYWLHGCYLKTATKIIIILMTSCLLIMHIIQIVYSVFWINRLFWHWKISGWLFMLTFCFLNISDCVTTENDFHVHDHRSSATTGTDKRYISSEHEI